MEIRARPERRSYFYVKNKKYEVKEIGKII